MNNSGIKRGLATIAVSALAVSGLGAFAGSAHADSLNTQTAAGTVVLHSLADNKASFADDGVNTTTSLVATAPSNITQVRFEYIVGGGDEVVIATVPRTNGAFVHEWDVPEALRGAGNVVVQAVGILAAGDITSTATGNLAITGAAAVEITDAAGSAVGVYRPVGDTGNYAAIVNAKTNDAVDANVEAVAPFAGIDSVYGELADGARNVAVVQSIDAGYNWAPTATPPAVQERDEALLAVSATGATDVQPVQVYSQSIASVTATPASTQVPDGGSTKVTVVVKDQNQKPIANALVARSDAPAGTGIRTNAAGEAVFTQTSAELTVRYYANKNAADAYDNNEDISAVATLTKYTATLASIASSSAKPAYDLDENGTVKLAVKDQNGNDFVPSNLRAQWVSTAFPAPAPAPAPAPVPGAIQNLASLADLSVPATEGTHVLRVWVESDSTPGYSAGDTKADELTVKAGQASIKWDNASIQAQKGGNATLSAKVVLGDGTPLVGRKIELSVATAGNASFAVTQPAGATKLTNGNVEVVTDADGGFSVTVTDPAVAVTDPVTPQPNELDVTVSPVATTFGNQTAEIDFEDVVVKSIVFDAVNMPDDNILGPGRRAVLNGTVRSESGLLRGTTVELKTSNGFFLADGAKRAADQVPAGSAATDLYGNWASAGDTITVTTSTTGKFKVSVSIGRDAGFDDDGQVNVTVTAKAGDKTQATTPLTFSSDNMLNAGDVEVSFAANQGAAANASTVLPKASTGRTVYLDVVATDQFGNRVSQPVELKDDHAARINGSTTTDTVISQFEGDAAAVALTSDVAGVQGVSGHLEGAPVNVLKDGDTVLAGFQAARDTKAAADGAESAKHNIEWYVVDLEASDYTLTSNGAELNPVGTLVTTTFEAKDQEGQALSGLSVNFFRSGPDNLQDGEGKPAVVTSPQGKATYSFVGAAEGTATLSTIVKDGATTIAAAAQSLQVKFGTEVVEPTEPEAITAKLAGKNNGKKADKLKVTTTPAATGAKVVLQFQNAKGKWKKAGTGVVKANGKVTIKAADNNGKAKTAYRVKVKKTATTKAATSNTRKVK